MVAVNLLDELAELGFQVPGDVEIALVDDNELAGALDIPMIAAAQAGDERGARAPKSCWRASKCRGGPSNTLSQG